MSENVIVEAFGHRKCPKLVEQVTSNNLDVRISALSVLCDEFRNPISIVGCNKSGIMGILAHMVTEIHELTRVRASRALSIAAQDSNGRSAMLDVDTPSKVMRALDDNNDIVRENIYLALLYMSEITLGTRALVEAGYPQVLVLKAADEAPQLKPVVLRILYNCIKDEGGLQAALSSGAVESCIELLASKFTEVRREAATTLGILCFSEMAKVTAIQVEGVERLCTLLNDPDWSVRSAVAAALMAITTVDAGKKAFIPAGGVDPLIELLYDDNLSVKLNALKVMANVAVQPDVRHQLQSSPKCLPALQIISQSENALLAKHASIATRAVVWEP